MNNKRDDSVDESIDYTDREFESDIYSDEYDTDLMQRDYDNGNFDPESDSADQYLKDTIIKNSILNGQRKQAMSQCIAYGYDPSKYDGLSKNDLESSENQLTGNDRFSKICNCCGADAGKYKQWWNRDAGYGVCVECVNDGDIKSMSKSCGEPGIHRPYRKDEAEPGSLDGVQSSQCPFCKSIDIEDLGWSEGDNNQSELDVHCNGCMTSYILEFKLIGYRSASFGMNRS